MAQSLYSQDEQRNAIVDDLLRDAVHAEQQAIEGPFFPNITAESLLTYAAECRAKAATFGHGIKAINDYIAGK